MVDYKILDKIIKNALNEDLGKDGDITSQAIFADEKGVYLLKSKDNGVLSGIDVFKRVYYLVDKNVVVENFFNDKDFIKNGDTIARIEGKILSILKAERVSLNFIQLMSGIATKTYNYSRLVKGKTKILDTRKTHPGLRMLEKYAVLCGGGFNHRFGLFDMILIKDNHIDGAGSITNAVQRVRKKYKNKYKIEVETRNLKEVEEALKMKVDRIMLDNMDIETIKKAVNLINGQCEIEISGNVDESKLNLYSDLNINYISIGGLTHSVKAFDFSLIKS